jgi:hypothetical protein
MNFLGLDLNRDYRFCHPAKHDFVGAIDEPRQAGVRSADAASSVDHLPPLRRPLSGRVQSEVILVPGSVSVHGLRAVDASREPSGHYIEVCLRAQRPKLYHLGIRSAVARNTLANANAVRDWRIYADFAQRLIGIARPLYAQDPFGVDLQETVYALDTTTIDLCLSVFPWALFRSAKAAIKLHTLLDLRGNIPTFIHI